MIIGLDEQTLIVAAVWMAAGLLIYFLYSRQRSKLRNPSEILPHASDFEKQ
jgi:APA family basic amino acid/polyamine antiporter